jgi:tRNA U34 5-carboxymethylaminomethyl modifying enzyme MnmG/GidA
MIWSQRGQSSRIACSLRGPNIVSCCGRTTPICDSHSLGTTLAYCRSEISKSSKRRGQPSKRNWPDWKRHGAAQILWLKWLRRPEVNYADLPNRNDSLPQEVIQQVEIALKYEGYIARQELEVAKLKGLEDKQIPSWIDYAKVPSLRTEARQKLTKIQPATLGQASRISGVSPSDVGVLMIWMKTGPPSREAGELAEQP